MALLASKFAISLAGVIAFGLEQGRATDPITGTNHSQLLILFRGCMEKVFAFLLTFIGSLKPVWMFPLVFMPTMIFISLVSLTMQPISDEQLNFKVPFVPLLPIASIFINSYLMMKLSFVTWIRFAIWMTIGLVIYAAYGWHNSSEEYRQNGLTPPNEIPSVKRKGVSNGH